MDPRHVIRDRLVPGVRSAEGPGALGWRGVALGLIACSSACLHAVPDAAPPVCPKQRVSNVARVSNPSDAGPTSDVIPALPPRDDLLPPTLRDEAGGDDYPPPDRSPALAEAPAPAAPWPAENALAMAPPGDTEVIAALPTAQLSTRAAHQQLAIDPNVSPYRVRLPQVYVACGEQYVSQIHICVSEAGLVSSMRILRHSIPLMDLQLAMVIPRWRYHPYLVDGRATAFCYSLNYRVR